MKMPDTLYAPRELLEQIAALPTIEEAADEASNDALDNMGFNNLPDTVYAIRYGNTGLWAVFHARPRGEAFFVHGLVVCTSQKRAMDWMVKMLPSAGGQSGIVEEMELGAACEIAKMRVGCNNKLLKHLLLCDNVAEPYAILID